MQLRRFTQYAPRTPVSLPQHWEEHGNHTERPAAYRLIARQSSAHFLQVSAHFLFGKACRCAMVAGRSARVAGLYARLMLLLCHMILRGARVVIAPNRPSLSAGRRPDTTYLLTRLCRETIDAFVGPLDRRLLHFSFTYADQPPINGIAGLGSREHGKVHSEPELRARDLRNSLIYRLEPQRLDDGRDSIRQPART